MAEEKQFAVINLAELKWPASLEIPSSRFRLLVAADTANMGTEVISAFASAALSNGVVYFCAWGPGCERFHDIVDEVMIEDDLGPRRFAGPRNTDIVMTTWHSDETLEEALDFLTTNAVPSDGFSAESGFRLVLCVDNADWAETAKRLLESTPYFI